MGRGEAEAEQHLIKKDRDGRGEDGQHQIKNASRRGRREAEAEAEQHLIKNVS